nr:DUF3375 family protein [Oceanococcus sp. HetDA_MAG_MS8]
MNIRERANRYERLSKHAAWTLLKASKSSYTLAFLESLFVDNSEVPVAQAHTALNAYLADWQSGWADTDVNAKVLLRQWTAAGYIRDQDGHYVMTDACATAISFASGLDRREIAATATHLKIMQDSVDDLLYALSEDQSERSDIVLAKMEELRAEHERIMAGDFELPSDQEQKEAVRHILAAATRLAGDFRLLDDQYRERSRLLFEQINASDDGRGAVIEQALDNEDAIKRTPAGMAFEGFYDLLANSHLRQEFQAKLKRLLESPAARFLEPGERRFLKRLTSELMAESGRVRSRRKRMGAALSGYVQTANRADRVEIDRMLAEVKRLALEIAKGVDVSPHHKMRSVAINTGSLALYSPDALRLAAPKHVNFDVEVVTHEVDDDLSDEQIERMSTFQVLALAKRMAEFIASQSGQTATVGDYAKASLITGGLEELIGTFRVAKAVGGLDLQMTEEIEFWTKAGERCRATVPAILMGTDRFPDDLRELNL